MTNANKIVVGGSGSGKTYFVKNYIIPQYVQAGIPVPIMDVKGHDFRDVSQIEVSHPRDFVKAYQKGYKVMRWKPSFSEPKTDEAGKEADKFYRGADNLLQIADYVHAVSPEIHNFSRPNHVYSSGFSKYWREARSFGASGTVDTQESTDLKKFIINNAMDIFVFNVDELNDKILKKLGVTMSDVENLKIPGEFYHYNKQTKKTTRHSPI